MAETATIESIDLRKRYGSLEALRGLSLCVPAGSICGFLGRNGAGKTTTLKILLGMARADSGQARVFGLNAGETASSVAIRARTGFVSEEKELFDDLSVGELVRFTASFYPKWRSDRAQRYLNRFGLNTGAKVKSLSRGTRTTLALLLAFCRGAELLVLDEPTSGLDPAVIEEVLQTLISQVAGEGTTVFFSSHQIAEVEQIADRVALIGGGRTLLEGPLDDVRESWKRIQFTFAGAAPEAAFRGPGIVRSHADGRTLTVVSSTGHEGVVEQARAWNPTAVEVFPVALKEIFLEVDGEEK